MVLLNARSCKTRMATLISSFSHQWQQTDQMRTPCSCCTIALWGVWTLLMPTFCYSFLWGKKTTVPWLSLWIVIPGATGPPIFGDFWCMEDPHGLSSIGHDVSKRNFHMEFLAGCSSKGMGQVGKNYISDLMWCGTLYDKYTLSHTTYTRMSTITIL